MKKFTRYKEAVVEADKTRELHVYLTRELGKKIYLVMTKDEAQKLNEELLKHEVY